MVSNNNGLTHSPMLKKRLLIVVLFACVACSRSFAETLYFSAIPLHDPAQEKLLYSVVSKKLAAKLNMNVEFIPSNDYEQTLELFQQGNIALAWFGGVTAMIARQRDPGAQAIVQGYEDQFYKTLLIANRRTGLEPSKEIPSGIRGMSLALGSELSTSGRLFPEYYLLQRFGEPIKKVFKKIGFSGLHEKTIEWVEQGLYDIGWVDYRVWYDLVHKGRINTNRVSVIWESPRFSDYQFVTRSDIEKTFGAGFRAKLQRALLALSADGQVMKIFARSHFIAASNEDFADVSNAALAIGLVDRNGRLITNSLVLDTKSHQQ